MSTTPAEAPTGRCDGACQADRGGRVHPPDHVRLQPTAPLSAAREPGWPLRRQRRVRRPGGSDPVWSRWALQMPGATAASTWTPRSLPTSRASNKTTRWKPHSSKARLPPVVRSATRPMLASVLVRCSCCPLAGAHSPEHPDRYVRWGVGGSTTLKRQDVPPRRTEIRLSAVVSAAQSLAVAHHRWSSARPGIDVVDLGCRIRASPPRKKHRGFASSAGPCHDRSPG
jgi:hypothetical protein